MGFRSTLITEHYSIVWPDWLFSKYDFLFDCNGILTSQYEFKTYSIGRGLNEDIRKALIETGCEDVLEGEGYTVIYLHECGGVTKVQIGKDKIYYGKPSGWVTQDTGEDYMHCYCYGCTDLEEQR